MVHWWMVVELCGSLVDGGRTLWFIGGWWLNSVDHWW